MRLNTDKRGWIYTLTLCILSIPAFLPERTTAEAHLTFGGIKEVSLTDPRGASPVPICLVSIVHQTIHPLGSAKDRHERQVSRLNLMEGDK